MTTPPPIRVALPLGIGDAHWSCTKLRALSRYHGNRPVEAHINCSLNHQTVGLLEIIPFIARAVQSDAAPFDVWVDMPPNHRFPKWSSLDGSQGWHGFDYVVVANGHLERGEQLSTYFRELGADSTDFTYEFNIAAADRDFVRQWERRVLVYLSGVGPNTGFHGNTWSQEHWVEVIRSLIAAGVRPALVGANTSDDSLYVEAVVRKLGADADRVDNIVGKTSIPQYVALIEAASCWVGLNSGGGIVSGMRATPTVMLWADSKHPIRGISPRNALHTKMKTSWLSDAQLAAGTYRTLSFGSPELTPENVVKAVLEIAR